MKTRGQSRIEVEENGAGTSAMVVEKDRVGFSTIEVGDKHAGSSRLGDLEVLEYHTHTLWAAGARGWSIRQLGNDQSKIYA